MSIGYLGLLQMVNDAEVAGEPLARIDLPISELDYATADIKNNGTPLWERPTNVPEGAAFTVGGVPVYLKED